MQSWRGSGTSGGGGSGARLQDTAAGDPWCTLPETEERGHMVGFGDTIYTHDIVCPVVVC